MKEPSMSDRMLRMAVLLIVVFGCLSTLAQSAPSATAFTVSPGDVLEITFRWTPEFNQTITVQPDGHTALMVTGDFSVQGLTTEQVHDEIVKRTSDKLRDPEVLVTLKESDKPHFVVAGEVMTPGRSDLRTATTALQAVLLAGGSKETAAMSHVILFRRLNTTTSEAHRLNFTRFDKQGRPVDDMLLQPGDMLLVSRDKLEKIGRFIKTFNLGIYLNPIPNSTL